MSDVERWYLVGDYDPEMRVGENGDWVTFSDYDALRDENEKWIKAFGEVDAELHHVRQNLAEVRTKAQTTISTLRQELEKKHEANGMPVK